MHDTENWIKIADDINDISFGDNDMAKVQVGEKSICLAKIKRSLKGCSAVCPHAGADLSEGFLDQKANIICPVHHYRFSLNSGRDTFDEGYFLKIYQIKEIEQGVFIKLE